MPQPIAAAITGSRHHVNLKTSGSASVIPGGLNSAFPLALGLLAYVLCTAVASQRHLPVTFEQSRPPLWRQAVGAVWAAHAQFVFWRLLVGMLERPAAAETHLIFSLFEPVLHRHAVVEHKTVALPEALCLGRVLQVVTGSTGVDDYEWGVTLFAENPDDLKEVVYTMRFDEASAIYADFGPFYTGIVTDIDTALNRLKHE